MILILHTLDRRFSNFFLEYHLQSMRTNLRQLPDLTFTRTLAGILRGWDLTIERNERTALVTINQSLVFVSVGHNILRKFCN